MRRTFGILCSGGMLLGLCAGASAVDPRQWTMSWQDEFSAASIDSTKWTFDLGNGFMSNGQWISGWGNNELEYYTSRSQNAFTQGGALHIKAIKESYNGFNYTSARMKTTGLFSQTYGRFEFRAKLPLGQGLWPALWMLSENDSYGGWAASGEIDVMEAKGQISSTVGGTIHYGGVWPNNQYSGASYTIPAGGTIADFHVYALEWESNAIRWYVDDQLYSTKTSWWSSGGAYPAPFDRPFHLLMNLAVGGNYAGNPDATTPFPAEMQVDYVRAYRATPTAVWNGASSADGNWSTSANWQGGAAPTAGAWIQFGPAAAPGNRVLSNNNLPAGSAINGISFQAGAPAYTVSGNAIQLAGPITNQGSSDPVIGVGIQLVDGGGSVDTGSRTLTLAGAVSGAAPLNKSGSGTLVLSGPNSLTGPTTILAGVLKATVTMPASALTINTAATFEASPAGGTASAPAALRVAGLTIGASATDASKVRITSAATGASVLLTPTLGLSGSGSSIDLTGNGFVWDYATAGERAARNASIRAWIKSARNNAGGGKWDGAAGITSSLLAGGSSDYAVAYMDSSILSSTGGKFMGSSGNGVSVDGTAVLVRYSIMGDVNLDGIVNFVDLVTAAQNYNSAGGGTWVTGDFNYDDNVNFIDLVSVAQHYNQALPASVPGASADCQADWEKAAVSVPEPGLLGAVALAWLILRRRAGAARPGAAGRGPTGSRS